MFDRLEDIEKRYIDLSDKINDPEIIADNATWRELVKEQSELAYIAKYGLLPFAFSNYSVTEETLLSAVLKEEEGLYALELELDPVGATEGYAVQMRGMSGQNAAFDGGSVLYTLYFGEDFILRKTNTREKYFIDYGFSIACDAVMDEEYFYSGEEGFSALTEEEKYENILPDDR